MKDIEIEQTTTHNIARMGFSGMRSFVTQFKCSCILINILPNHLMNLFSNVNYNASEKEYNK